MWLRRMCPDLDLSTVISAELLVSFFTESLTDSTQFFAKYIFYLVFSLLTRLVLPQILVDAVGGKMELIFSGKYQILILTVNL